MISKILKFFVRPPHVIRVSPHTKKVEIAPAKYLDKYDSNKHRDDDDE